MQLTPRCLLAPPGYNQLFGVGDDPEPQTGKKRHGGHKGSAKAKRARHSYGCGKDCQCATKGMGACGRMGDVGGGAYEDDEGHGECCVS